MARGRGAKEPTGASANIKALIDSQEKQPKDPELPETLGLTKPVWFLVDPRKSKRLPYWDAVITVRAMPLLHHRAPLRLSLSLPAPPPTAKSGAPFYRRAGGAAFHGDRDAVRARAARVGRLELAPLPGQPRHRRRLYHGHRAAVSADRRDERRQEEWARRDLRVEAVGDRVQ
eukprot:2762342-Prymnesium_polylepis.1